MHHVVLAAATGDSMAWLTGINLVPVGATSVLVIVALMVYTGRLIPRSTHDAIVRARDDRIRTLEEANRRIESARDLQAQSIAEQTEQGRLMLAAMEGLKQAALGQEGPPR